jgi:hypothetical protein
MATGLTMLLLLICTSKALDAAVNKEAAASPLPRRGILTKLDSHIVDFLQRYESLVRQGPQGAAEEH